MSAPRFILGLKASGSKMIHRKMRTVSREVTPATVEEFRAEMLQFINSNLFDQYVVSAMTQARDDHSRCIDCERPMPLDSNWRRLCSAAPTLRWCRNSKEGF